MRGPGFVGGVALVFEGAVGAAGFARDADLAAMVDELVAELNPTVLRDDFDQVLLDLDGIVVLCQFKALGKAVDVRVDHDAGRNAVPASENDVGGFARHTGEFEHFVQCLRDFAMKAFDQHAGCALNALRLVAVEAGALDDLFERGQCRCGELLRARVEAEEFGGDHVHPHVGGLRGEDGGDGEFEGVAVIERADDVGVGLAQGVEDGCDALGSKRFGRFTALELGRNGFAGRDLAGVGGGHAFDGGFAGCGF